MGRHSLCGLRPLAIATCATALLLAGPAAAEAMTINVNSTLDAVDPAPGDANCDTGAGPPANKCTLRAAVQTANANAGPDTIVLPAGTFQLSIPGRSQPDDKGDLNITGETTITGAGAASTIVDGGGASVDRVFDVTGGPVTMSGLTIRHGDAGGGNGGGIESTARLILNDVTLSGNTTGPTAGPTAGNGGGLSQDASGVATLTHVTIDGNAAKDCGGASAGQFNATVDVRGGSVISNNHALIGGGGCDIGTGRFEVTDSRVTGNTACTDPLLGSCNDTGLSTEGRAGGLVEEFGVVIVTRSVVDNNTARSGAGLLEDGGEAVVVVDSTVRDNHATGTSTASGGGVEEYGEGSVFISGSTFTGNTATLSGGAVDGGGGAKMTLVNTTISGNTAGAGVTDGVGGGISNTGADDIRLTNVTLSGNQAVGSSGGDNLDNCPSSSDCVIQLTNTIVAGGASGNCAGTITSLGHNLDDANTCLFAASGDQHGVNPMLGALATNGGPTQTMALLPGSPATDAGDSAACPSADQRGVTRPRGAACDIGAYESAPPIAVTGPAGPIGATTTLISGTAANPDLVAGSVSFEYGTSMSYGSVTSSQPLGPATTATIFPAAIAGLAPGTLYHYRIVATNPDGTTFGADRTFTTGTVPNDFTILAASGNSKGRITLTIAAPAAGSFSASATAKRKKSKAIAYGKGSASSPGTGTVKLTIKPGKKGRSALKASRKLRVSVAVKFSPTGGKPKTKKTTLTVNNGR